MDATAYYKYYENAIYPKLGINNTVIIYWRKEAKQNRKNWNFIASAQRNNIASAVKFIFHFSTVQSECKIVVSVLSLYSRSPSKAQLSCRE